MLEESAQSIEMENSESDSQMPMRRQETGDLQ
jgi:hypothetical protein